MHHTYWHESQLPSSSNGKSDDTSFGEGLLKILYQDEQSLASRPFKQFIGRSLEYFQLKKTTNFRSIFDKKLFDAIGSDELWVKTIADMNKKHGTPDKLLHIDPINSESAFVIFKTDIGKATYKITLSASEPGKISSILLKHYE